MVSSRNIRRQKTQKIQRYKAIYNCLDLSDSKSNSALAGFLRIEFRDSESIDHITPKPAKSAMTMFVDAMILFAAKVDSALKHHGHGMMTPQINVIMYACSRIKANHLYLGESSRLYPTTLSVSDFYNALLTLGGQFFNCRWQMMMYAYYKDDFTYLSDAFDRHAIQHPHLGHPTVARSYASASSGGHWSGRSYYTYHEHRLAACTYTDMMVEGQFMPDCILPKVKISVWGDPNYWARDLGVHSVEYCEPQLMTAKMFTAWHRFQRMKELIPILQEVFPENICFQILSMLDESEVGMSLRFKCNDQEILNIYRVDSYFKK